MARYRAEIEGRRGPASRLGSAKSQIRAIVNGWHSGVDVCGGPVTYGKKDDGADEFLVYMTSGSNGRYSSKLLGTIRTDANGVPTFYPAK